MMTERKHHDETTPAGFNPFCDIVLVITFLTRLPLPLSTNLSRSLATASWAFPFAGIITGGVAGGVFLGAVYLGSPLTIAILLGLATSVLVSGGLHEDGLADVADGFGGGVSRDRKLEIMHDSRIGAYGVLALVFCVALKFAALYTIAENGGTLIVFTVMLCSAIFSRSLLPLVMASLPHARTDGLSKNAGRPGVGASMMSFCLGAIGVVTLFYPAFPLSLMGMLFSCAAVGFMCLLAKRQIGGQTGDVIGAVQQIGEVAFLIALSVMLGGDL